MLLLLLPAVHRNERVYIAISVLGSGLFIGQNKKKGGGKLARQDAMARRARGGQGVPRVEQDA